MSKVKVLHIGTVDKAGGIENYLINYCENFDYSNIDVSFINIYPSAVEEKFYKKLSQYGNFYEMPSFKKRPIKYIKQFLKLQKEQQFDIVHYNMNSACFLVPLIAAKFAKVKTIIAHSHNSSSDCGLIKKIVHNINRHFIPLFANKYYACSLQAGKWFFRKKIIESNNFRVVNNAIKLEKYSFNKDVRNNIRKKLNIDDSITVIGHVGRFSYQKNHNFLIDIFKDYNNINKNSKLLLVGFGYLEEEIKEKVKKMKLEKNVIFLGERSDVNQLMSAFDILALPSLYEGLGMVLIEAQACGLPCITTTDIPEEACVSDNFYRCSLKDSSNIWANKINEIKINTKRNDVNIESYDIVKCTKKLQQDYINFNKIKICHFVNGLVNGGVEKVIINYFSNMKNKDDYDLHVITQGESDSKCLKEFEDLGFTIHTVTKKKISLFKNYKDIRNILKKEKFDIVHCHMTTTNFFPLLYSKLSGVKVRISHSHLDNSVIPFMDRIYITLTKLVSKTRFACSKSASTYLFGKNKNVTIINNAINIDNFKYNEKIRKDIRKKLNISEDKIVIGHVGRFVDQKNHEFIIDLFKKLSKDNDRYELLLIGTGELEDSIKDKVKEYNLSNKVKFLGTRNDVYNVMQTFDIFILPSKFEGLGIVLIEAQVSGLKCFASSNTPEEVKVTNNIKLLDLDIDLWKKEINKVKDFKREDKSNEISKHGFDIKIESNKLDSIYKELLNKK